MCQVALVEAVRIETQKVIREDLELRLHLTLRRLERFGVDDTAKLLVNSVVLDGEEVLCELLHDLAESQLIDMTVRVQPPNLGPNVFKDSLPVNHVLKLILDSVSGIHFHLRLPNVVQNLLDVRDNESRKFLLTKHILCVVFKVLFTLEPGLVCEQGVVQSSSLSVGGSPIKPVGRAVSLEQ